MKPWYCLGVIGFSIFAFLWEGEPAEQPRLKMGVVGYEGHGSLFTKELNSGLGEKIGLVVTHVWHRDPIPPDDQRKYGFSAVAAPGDMIGKVDGVFIAETLPFRYPELAAPFHQSRRPDLSQPSPSCDCAGSGPADQTRPGIQKPHPGRFGPGRRPPGHGDQTGESESAPLKVVNVTGPSDHFWNYVPTSSAPWSALWAPASRKSRPRTWRSMKKGSPSGIRC